MHSSSWRACCGRRALWREAVDARLRLPAATAAFANTGRRRSSHACATDGGTICSTPLSATCVADAAAAKRRSDKWAPASLETLTEAADEVPLPRLLPNEMHPRFSTAKMQRCRTCRAHEGSVRAASCERQVMNRCKKQRIAHNCPTTWRIESSCCHSDNEVIGLMANIAVVKASSCVVFWRPCPEENAAAMCV